MSSHGNFGLPRFSFAHWLIFQALSLGGFFALASFVHFELDTNINDTFSVAAVYVAIVAAIFLGNEDRAAAKRGEPTLLDILIEQYRR